MRADARHIAGAKARIGSAGRDAHQMPAFFSSAVRPKGWLHKRWGFRSGLLLILTLCCLAAIPQSARPGTSSLQQIQQLAADQRWQDLAQLLAPIPARSADQDFYYGTALAHLQRYPEAEAAFDAGRRVAPRDPRFPTELAGVAFQQKRYAAAARLLRHALRLDPRDAYANDFLGTVYYLQGNLPASLKYSNRVTPVAKPQITAIRDEPVPSVSPALLDRAFAFSPAATLQLPQFLTTEARLDGLGIFPQYSLDLDARGGPEDAARFDVVFRAAERDGIGPSKLLALGLLLRGLPFQSVNPEVYDIRHQAINFVSMCRWDAQKRRILAQLSGPFEHNPGLGVSLATDLRDEHWAIRNGFAGPAPVLASVGMRHEQATFSLASHAAPWNWSAGAEVSHRDFRSIQPGTVLSPALLARGYQLKQVVSLDATLLRIPEDRFTLSASVSSQAARLWSQPQETFDKLQGSFGWQWFPQPKGDTWETRQLIRAGTTIGAAPFDELYMLGLERDNDLPLRAHIGTRDGRKGSAPLGRAYLLSNWEMDRSIYSNGLTAVRLGPFLDIGKVGKLTDSSPAPAAALALHKWLFDLGAQCKLRVLGVGVAFSYGKDLRTGNNAFYVTVLPKSGPTE